MNAFAGYSPVLVTGAAGFVGACLVRALLARGATVHALLRPQSKPWRLQDVRTQLTVHHADLRDRAQVAQVLDAVHPVLVYHLATYGAYERQADAERILASNIFGTHYLLEECERCGVRLLVNAGSSSEYGYKSGPMKETDVLEPASHYAVAKAAQTHLCTLKARAGKLPVVVFRLFSVYGPWEEPDRLMPTMIRRARAGLPLEMAAPDLARDFVYVDDVVRAMLDVPRLRDLSGEILNLGSGIETTLASVVATIKELLHSPSAVQWGAMPPRRWDTSRWVCDPSHTRQVLGWSAQVNLRDGLSRMAAWMQQVGDNYGANDARAAD